MVMLHVWRGPTQGYLFGVEQRFEAKRVQVQALEAVLDHPFPLSCWTDQIDYRFDLRQCCFYACYSHGIGIEAWRSQPGKPDIALVKRRRAIGRRRRINKMKYLVAISALFIVMALAPAANAAACAGGLYRATCVAGAYDYVVVRRGAAVAVRRPVVVHRRAVVVR
jgi:hypothetical protein